MDKWERDLKIAELIAESEEQRRFDEFYEKIPNVIIRHKTQELHLPLIFNINLLEDEVEEVIEAIRNGEIEGEYFEF